MQDTSLLVTKRRVVAAFEARLKDTLASIENLEEVLTEGTRSQDEETSSDSLGRKSEEMMQDLENHGIIAGDAKNKQLALASLNLDAMLDEVAVGALVVTNHARMLVCTALEPLEVDGQTYVGVSIQAPLIEQLLGKKVGDSVTFNERTLSIEAIA